MRLRLFILISLTVTCAGAGWFLHTRDIPAKTVDSLRLLFAGKPPPKKMTASSTLEHNIRSRLGELEVPESTMTVRATSDSIREVRLIIPQGRPLEWIVWLLSGAAEGTSFRVTDCISSPDGSRCTIRFTPSSPGEKIVALSLRRASRFSTGSTKMAIIISDFNFSAGRTAIEILSFPHPLTLGLFPSRALPAQTARLSGEYRKEIIILLPMEGAAPALIDRSVPRLMVHFTEERVRSMLSDAAAAVPSFSGFSNIGGARVLSDSRITGIIFSEIKKKRGYFIERPVAIQSLVAPQARRYGVPVATVDFVIDSSLPKNAQRDALLHYGNEARKRGAGVLLCASSGKTLRAIESALPGLTRNGVALSYVSELFSSGENNKKQ
ncbi:MAG: divergent polysaccharide deacetylase family protein [Chitinispirillaceae bacterium]|nr:divergent polysaccharide deacetylase family protein [Chitinispirillaceae bacterium]